MNYKVENSELLAVALAHRRMAWWCFGSLPAIYVSLLIAGLVFFTFDVPVLVVNSFVLLLVISLNAIVAKFAFTVARALYGTFTAWAFVVFVLIPCAGIIGVIILSGEIVEYLKKRDLAVGFMGATKNQIAALQGSLTPP